MASVKENLKNFLIWKTLLKVELWHNPKNCGKFFAIQLVFVAIAAKLPSASTGSRARTGRGRPRPLNFATGTLNGGYSMAKLTDKPDLATMRAFIYLVHELFGPLPYWDKNLDKRMSWLDVLESLATILVHEEMRYFADNKSWEREKQRKYRLINQLFSSGPPLDLPGDLKFEAAVVICAKALGWRNYAET